MTPPPPLRVLHLTAGSDAGGLSRYILDLGTAMTAAGHTVAVAGERGAWHDLFAKSSLPWIDVPLKGHPWALWRASRTLSRWIERNPIDLLHVHYRRPTLVGRLIQRSHPLPMLYTLHLSDLAVRGPMGLLSDFGDHTHAPSADALRWLAHVPRVPADDITVIPHGIDPARFAVPDGATRAAARASFDISPGQTVAAYVGRFDHPKNVGWLLDVAAALPMVCLLLVGEGPDEPALRARIAKDRLTNVTLLVGRRDPVPVYHAADALLLPSGREGFSLVCAEAMSCGIPVLRTRTAGTSELVVENGTGRSTPIDRHAFVSAAATFLTDPDPLRQLGRRAAQHVRQRLTFDRQLSETIALYRQLIAARLLPISGR